MPAVTGGSLPQGEWCLSCTALFRERPFLTSLVWVFRMLLSLCSHLLGVQTVRRLANIPGQPARPGNALASACVQARGLFSSPHKGCASWGPGPPRPPRLFVTSWPTRPYPTGQWVPQGRRQVPFTSVPGCPAQTFDLSAQSVAPCTSSMAPVPLESAQFPKPRPGMVPGPPPCHAPVAPCALPGARLARPCSYLHVGIEGRDPHLGDLLFHAHVDLS